MRAEGWLAAVLDGRELDDVLTDDDGVVRLVVDPLAVSGVSRPRARTSSGDRAGLPARDLALAGRRADVGPVLLRSHRSHHPAHRGQSTRRGVSAPERPAPPSRSAASRSAGTACAVLSGVDWRVDDGRPLGRSSGPNGSGKTTLLQVAGGPAVADGRDGGGPGRAPGPCRRPDAASARGPGQRSGHAAAAADLAARDVVVSGRHGALETWWNRYTRGGLGEGGPAPGPRRCGGHRGPPVRRDLRGRAPTGAPGPGAHERPGAAPARRAVRRPRPGRPRAVAGPAGRLWPPTRTARRSSWSPTTVRRSRPDSPTVASCAAAR